MTILSLCQLVSNRSASPPPGIKKSLANPLTRPSPTYEKTYINSDTNAADVFNICARRCFFLRFFLRHHLSLQNPFCATTRPAKPFRSVDTLIFVIHFKFAVVSLVFFVSGVSPVSTTSVTTLEVFLA
jgi:hypothetical protein